MISRRTLLATAAATGTALSGVTALTVPARAAGRPGVRVGRTTVEYAAHPLGLDAARPRLTWQLDSGERGRSQRAYQLRVATSPGRLPDPDVWDSGKVTSDRSVLVPYAGPALRPRTRYHWSVRIWDDRGRPTAWSAPAWWETALPAKEPWQARWIAAPAALTAPPSLDGASWIWHPTGSDDPADTPAGARWFRGAFEAPAGVRRARLVITADDGCTVYVNGTEVADQPVFSAQGGSWSHPIVVEVTDALRRGGNVLAVKAVNGERSPAGVLAVLELTGPDGTDHLRTGGDWRSTDREPSGDWHSPGHDDSAWQQAWPVAAYGEAPWTSLRPLRTPTQLRRAFTVPPGKSVARARLYATALGLYEAHINGHRVGTDELAPGWTDYHRRVQYQSYDVTDAVRGGDNAIGVTLAAGWYAGEVGWFGNQQYGERPAFIGQLEVTYEDGSIDRVVTDTHWKCATGPLLTADLMAGEEYDARHETPGWTGPGFDDARWTPVQGLSVDTPPLVAQIDAPTRVTRELTAREVTEPRPGVFVFDLGQNMVGGVRLKVSGRAGQRVRLRHAEVLDKDGSVYTANLRTVRATDTYTLRGGGTETYRPRFTFHGFRYVEVTGYPGRPPKDAVTGLVMHTDAPGTMSFETDVPMLNQLHSNITWGQRGNFLSVPTDTPARDERLGWTGDINVFSATASYTLESARFLTKWLTDLRDGQSAQGAFPDVAPRMADVGEGAAGWGDAGVTVPWNLYQAYGDRAVLADSFPAMRSWIAYLEKHSTNWLRPAEGYGDWLNVEDETPKDVVATAYFAHVTDLTARAAKALGEDPAPYTSRFASIRDAFRAAYVKGGRITGDTQTGYVLALSMDLLDEGERKAAADRLVALIDAKGGHLSTGFLGTPRLLPALTDTGHTDVAYRLLHQRTFPSWGYQIDKGATTMWERWDSIRPDGSFQDVGMNSFNHYAYGCVGEWMYRNITGIAPGAPGFRKVVVRPRPGGEVRSATGRHDTPYGPVTTHWERRGEDGLVLSVSVPVNTTAEIWVPAERAAEVRHDGAEFARRDGDCAVFTAGSGTYRFSTA